MSTRERLSIGFLHETGEILWTSERDGWNHLYLYCQRANGAPLQLTSGPWVIHKIELVDEKNRRVYFLAGGREKGEDPYQTHIYSVSLDGKGLTLLTPENATHAGSVSPDGAYFVDNFSRPDLPGASVLRRMKDGSEVRTLEKEIQAACWRRGGNSPKHFRERVRTARKMSMDSSGGLRTLIPRGSIPSSSTSTRGHKLILFRKRFNPRSDAAACKRSPNWALSL